MVIVCDRFIFRTYAVRGISGQELAGVTSLVSKGFTNSECVDYSDN